MKILLTGSAGFIGTHTSRKLSSLGHAVSGVDPKQNFATTDFVLLSQLVREFQPERVVHLGANPSTSVSLQNPYHDFYCNAYGTLNLLEALRLAECSAPIIFASTVKVYPGYDGLIAPLGFSKKTAETYIAEYSRITGAPYVINRPSTVYGPEQNGSAECGWVAAFVQYARDNATITIRGDGTQSRDILYIEDFVDLMVDQLYNIDLYAGNIYDMGGGASNEVSLIEMLDHLQYDNVDYAPRLIGDLQRVVTDNTKVSQVNGWHPTVSWKQGVDIMRGLA